MLVLAKALTSLWGYPSSGLQSIMAPHLTWLAPGILKSAVCSQRFILRSNLPNTSTEPENETYSQKKIRSELSDRSRHHPSTDRSYPPSFRGSHGGNRPWSGRDDSIPVGEAKSLACCGTRS